MIHYDTALFREYIGIESKLVNELRLFREEMKTEIREFKIAVSDFTPAVNNCNRRKNDLAACVEAVERYQRDGSAAAKSSIGDAISKLKLELNDCDLELIRNDIEIARDTGRKSLKIHPPRTNRRERTRLKSRGTGHSKRRTSGPGAAHGRSWDAPPPTPYCCEPRPTEMLPSRNSIIIKTRR